MPDGPSEAYVVLASGEKVPVRVLRWWWINRAESTWAADIEVPSYGLVTGMPGEWLYRGRDVSSAERPELVKSRKGRVVSERRTTLGERFGSKLPGEVLPDGSSMS